MPLQSLFTDEWFSPWADDFTSATQFVVVAAALCLRNLSSKKKYHPDGLALSFGSLIQCCCHAFAISLHWWMIFSMGWRIYIGNSIRRCCCSAVSSQSLFQGKISSQWVCAFIWQFNSILLPCLCDLSSLMKDFLHGLTILDWQLNSSLLLRLCNLSSKKISSRWVCFFIWQFNSIFLLCLCNLSSLMKKFPWVDALLWYFKFLFQFDIIAASSQSLSF